MGFPGVSDRKESTRNVGDWGLIPVLGRSPGGGHGNPLQYSCLENPHGQRSLAGYHRSGRKESDTTRRLSTHKNDGVERREEGGRIGDRMDSLIRSFALNGGTRGKCELRVFCIAIFSVGRNYSLFLC